MATITDTKRLADTPSISLTKEFPVATSADDAVRRRLQDCSYRFVFDKVTWHYEDTILTLRGSVPSFYLKQVLQELLRNLEEVGRIVNNVHVVSSTGLSSEWPEQAR